MKKIFYLVALVTISLLFVQCGKNGLGKHRGHAYVDLGLSVKWATCNVGAESPEDSGDYFAWGEVKPKENYSWDTYEHGTRIKNNLTKYNSSDNKTILDPENDAAHVNWGGKWRMPTKEEQDELCNNCTWTWTKQNGVDGYNVIGPNGNSIFLPVTGYMYDSYIHYESNGYYLSSSLVTIWDDLGCAYFLLFDSEDVRVDMNFRSYGLFVRPVCQ